MSATNFRDFFFTFLKPYKLFGITPFKNSKNKLNVNLCFPQIWIIIVLAILLYWIGIVLTFLEDHKNAHKLSIIANYIQIITNTIAFTVALTYPLIQRITVNSIINSFERVDQELNYLKIKINYKADSRSYRVLIISCCLILLATTMYDFFVAVVIMSTLKAWYWLVTIIPLIIYSIALSQAYVVIGFIKKRCQLINQVIWEFQTSDKSSVVNAKNIVIVSIFNDTTPIISLSELFSKLFIALNELCELSQLIEKLFGLLFLTTFSAIFAVTSIQLFYCYLVITTASSENGYSIWSLIQSVNIILINLILILGITSVCEAVSTEVRNLLYYLKFAEILFPIYNTLIDWLT